MNQAVLPPLDLIVHQASKVLEIVFANGERHRLPFEFLRVHSPSAEVQGHGPGQEVLQTGKRDVGLVDIEPVGHYGIKPTFSDGHDSGIFSWTYLHHLASHQTQLWADHLRRLSEAGLDRDSPMPSPHGGACGHH
jgi:DUF971 family protein